MSVWDRGRSAAEEQDKAASEAEQARIAEFYTRSEGLLREWTEELHVEISEIEAQYQAHVSEGWNRGEEREHIKTTFTCEGRKFTAVCNYLGLSVTLQGNFANTLEEIGEAIARIEEIEEREREQAARKRGIRRLWSRWID